jgi:hypothetical protein
MTDAIEIDRIRLAALRMEWKLAWEGLPLAIRGSVRLPSFEFHDVSGLWGRWRGELCALSLSRKLVHEATWPCVVEVLRHEMAHQISDQAFHADEPPHGPRFVEACRLVRADPRASSTLPSIYERIESEPTVRDERRDTLRKLLALAASPHVAEAEAAMLKAHAWMVKYNVTPDAAGVHDYGSICLGEPVGRHTGADYELAALLREFFFVETVYIFMVQPDAVRVGRVLEITGTHENVKMAAHVFHFLRRAAAAEARVRGVGRRTDYTMGFYRGVREKLQRQRSELVVRLSHTQALILMATTRLHAVIRARHLHLRTTRHRGRKMDSDTFNAGVSAGRKVILHRPIERHGAGRHALPA